MATLIARGVRGRYANPVSGIGLLVRPFQRTGARGGKSGEFPLCRPGVP